MIKDGPNLSKDFLNWIEINNFKDKTIVEIGSGYSTLFFANNFKFVYSFESDGYWLQKLQTIISENNINNVNLSIFDKTIISSNEFIDLIKIADVFLIDNNPNYMRRDIFAEFISKYKKDESIIILDNGTWNIDTYKFLRERYYCIDFPRIQEDNRQTETTVFFKKIENKINNSII